MNKKYIYGLIAATIIVLAGIHFIQCQSNLIPRTVLFGNPDKKSVSISPDGTTIAYAAPYNGVMNIWIQSIDQHEKPFPITSDTHRGISSYFWSKDNNAIFYYQDNDGDENWQIFQVDIATQAVTPITPFKDAQSVLLKYRKEFPHELLLTINKEDKRYNDVYHLNLHTKELTLKEKNPGTVESWYADDALQVRAAVRTEPDGSKTLVVRAINGSWQPVKQWSFEDSFSTYAIGLNKQATGMYMVDSSNTNTAQAIFFDFEIQKSTVLAHDDTYDANSFLLHPNTKQPIFATFIKERLDHVLLDPAHAADIATIKQLDDGDFSIVDYDEQFNKWIVSFVHDNGPTRYYLYDHTTQRAVFLFVNNEALAQYTLAHKEPISFITRDGLTLHGYLTRATYRCAKPALILLVHGGPLARDEWEYDADVQWLANRGLQVLQINYRGSTGYGRAFVNASIGERGRKMQDDLVDGVQWALAHNLADPARVGIMGFSYGGYATLAAAAFSPDVFCCGIDAFGASNLITFLQTIPPYWATTYLPYYKKFVGDPTKDVALLQERSPLFHADKIKIPLLIAQGANDVRIKKEESEQIVAALQEKGIPHEYLLFPDEGHGFVRPENRLTFYAAAEKFLARHLGTRAEG